MTNGGVEGELLLSFEKRQITGEYRRYFEVKRSNFFATIEGFPKLWACFQLLDEIWYRELDDLERIADLKRALPVLLFATAHAQFRVAFELGFSCCIGEAWNVTRSAIEAVAHAEKLLREPELTKIWLEKDDGHVQRKAFQAAFIKSRFPQEYGLVALRKYWSQYSEWGTHTNLSAIARRFRKEETPTDVNWKINYLEADPRNLATYLFSLLLASVEMEKRLLAGFETRLQFDDNLMRLRARLEASREETRQDIIQRFNIQRPS